MLESIYNRKLNELATYRDLVIGAVFGFVPIGGIIADKILIKLRLPTCHPEQAISLSIQKAAILKPSLYAALKIRLQFACVVVVVPVVEEVCYRFSLQREILPVIIKGHVDDKYSTIASLAITSFLFTLAHFEPSLKGKNIFLLTGIAISGLIYGILAECTNSILAPTVAHMGNNAFAFRNAYRRGRLRM